MVAVQAVSGGLLAAATVLQIAAAVVALWLLPGSRRHLAWVFLTMALVIQAWRRMYAALVVESSPMHDAVTALAASLFMLASVVAIRALIVSHRRTNEELSLAHAEAQLYLDISGAIVVVMDPAGHFLQVNEKGRTILGIEDERIDGIEEWFSRLPSPDMREELDAGFRTFMTGEYGDDQYLEYPIITPRGEERYIFWHRHIVRDEVGRVRGIVSAGMDMTHRRAAEREVAFRSQLLDRTSDAIIVTETENDRDGVIVYANDAACSMAHKRCDQLVGGNMREFLRGEWLEVHDDRRRQLRHAGSVIGKLEVDFGNGDPIPIEANTHMIEADGRQLAVSVLRDVRERNRAEAMIRHMAYHDALTALPNRTLFEDRALMAMAHASRHGERLSLLFLDVDGLKLVNDTCGHAVADGVLRKLAERLSGAFRAEDTVARIGGDEFAILLPGADAETTRAVARKALNEMQRAFTVLGKEVHMSISIGASEFPGDGETFDELLASADAAMYRSKERGGNGVSFFTADMKRDMLDVLSLRHDLGVGLERGEFVLYYQPQVRMSTGEIFGAEALLRWNHPERGLLRPAAFMKLAEETGVIEPIGIWVLEEVCSQARQWTASGALRQVAVNVSARQFRETDFASRVADVLNRTGFEPSRLQLEVTETATMEDPASAIEALHSLVELGVTIAIDDFGTGHSSMAYLKRFPVSTIKIDRVFVADIDGPEGGRLFVSTMISLAKSLGLDAIAEGVERSEQVALLRALGCDRAQGYLYHAPTTVAEFEKVLRANQSRRGSAPVEAAGLAEDVAE